MADISVVCRYDMCYVEWEDASSVREWHSEDEAAKFAGAPVVVQQVGWVFENTSTHLILFGRFNDGNYGLLQRIPHSIIRRCELIAFPLVVRLT